MLKIMASRVYICFSVRLPTAVGNISGCFGHGNHGLKKKKISRRKKSSKLRPIWAYMVIVFRHFVDTQFHHTNNSSNQGTQLEVRKLDETWNINAKKKSSPEKNCIPVRQYIYVCQLQKADKDFLFLY